MRQIAGLIIVSLLVPAPALAQAAPSAPAERRLSQQQIEAVLAEAAKKREAAERRALADEAERQSRPIHSEVGVSVGTGGYREIYGTAVYPLGGDGAAAISLDYLDLGKRRNRR